MNRNRTPLSAAALAGGQSRRMGTDKALLPLVAGGEPMLGVVLKRLSAVADDVLVVADDRAKYAALGARVVPDLRPDVGALGGIQAAIASSAHDHCLVVACDMPFLACPFCGEWPMSPAITMSWSRWFQVRAGSGATACIPDAPRDL